MEEGTTREDLKAAVMSKARDLLRGELTPDELRAVVEAVSAAATWPQFGEPPEAGLEGYTEDELIAELQDLKKDKEREAGQAE